MRPTAILAVAAVLLALPGAPLVAQHGHDHSTEPEPRIPADARLGTVPFVTSCSEAAQPGFRRGLALLHHMMYEQAEEQFAAVAAAEPACAIAHWGVAMTLFHPLWPDRPSPADFERGAAALERAAAGELAAHERALVEAAQAFYRDWRTASHGDRLAAFEARLAEAAAAHPDDLDVVALHALSLIATAPPGDRSLAHQQRAGEILRGLHDREATHPGAIHYGIHAFDHPPLAHRAVDLAHGYDKIAPEVPHALHMPTHIFVRLGHWQEVIDWNRRSAAAALASPVDGAVSHHYPHAADYLMYAHLQRGEDAAARRLLDELLSHERFQPTFISAYALAAAPARLALERGEWAAAASLPVGLPESIPWDRSPGALAIAHYARGLGGARGGDLDLARRSLAELDRLEASAGEQDQGYWVEQIGIQRQVIAAWLALAEDRTDEALAAMTRAADLEDAAEKHPVTPGAVLPARELLGDMLLALDRPAEAQAAYEASLAHSPKRFNTLARAAQAAQAAGDAEGARRHSQELLDVAAGAARPELARAREVVGG
jgi:hypothetical protein